MPDAGKFSFNIYAYQPTLSTYSSNISLNSYSVCACGAREADYHLVIFHSIKRYKIDFKTSSYFSISEWYIS